MIQSVIFLFRILSQATLKNCCDQMFEVNTKIIRFLHHQKCAESLVRSGNLVAYS